jgi:uncharacterized membrane protein YdfJ with MMPL/SSD domain
MTHAIAEPATTQPKRPVIAHTLRILAIPIVLFWVGFAVLVNVAAPQLEVVGEQHSAPTPTRTTTRSSASCGRIPSTSSTSRTSGATR